MEPEYGPLPLTVDRGPVNYRIYVAEAYEACTKAMTEYTDSSNVYVGMVIETQAREHKAAMTELKADNEKLTMVVKGKKKQMRGVEHELKTTKNLLKKSKRREGALRVQLNKLATKNREISKALSRKNEEVAQMMEVDVEYNPVHAIVDGLANLCSVPGPNTVRVQVRSWFG
jgi:septal ring factor EnvC (AmiA/AmiB activator)